MKYSVFILFLLVVSLSVNAEAQETGKSKDDNLPVTVSIAIAGSVVSGLFLLWLHHAKTKQEIKLHQKYARFNKKQLIYSLLLQYFFEDMDFAYHLGKNPNWKIQRHIYNELLLIGSKPIIDAYNEYILKYDQVDKSQKTILEKKIIIEIRRDLYEEKLAENEIKFFHPSADTSEVFDLIGKHRAILESMKLFDLESLSLMDVTEVNKKTSIDIKELEKMKETAKNEIKLETEFQDLLEKYYSRLRS